MCIQTRYPRINKESLLPIASDLGMKGANADAWYPPGHGDIYASFHNSGLLDTLLAQGKEYVFVSNIDNLGATVDLSILHHLMSQPASRRCEFIMEVTNKTRSDVKVRAALWRSVARHRLISGFIRVLFVLSCFVYYYFFFYQAMIHRGVVGVTGV